MGTSSSLTVAGTPSKSLHISACYCSRAVLTHIFCKGFTQCTNSLSVNRLDYFVIERLRNNKNSLKCELSSDTLFPKNLGIDLYRLIEHL